MEDIRTKVLARFIGDVFLADLAAGGIYDRALKRGKGEGATPAAFAVIPGDLARVPVLRPSIVVTGPNEVETSDGPSHVGGGEPVLRQGFLRINYYTPANADGKILLDQLDARVRWLLNGWQPNVGTGYPATFTALEMSDNIDSEEFEGAKQAVRRVHVEYLRAVNG